MKKVGLQKDAKYQSKQGCGDGFIKKCNKLNLSFMAIILGGEICFLLIGCNIKLVIVLALSFLFPIGNLLIINSTPLQYKGKL